jgi:hypothetical protein
MRRSRFFQSITRRNIQGTYHRHHGATVDNILPFMQQPSSPRIQLFSRLQRTFSSWQGHGTDLLDDSLGHNYGVPKIIIHGHSESGFDILNMIKNKDPSDENLKKTGTYVV